MKKLISAIAVVIFTINSNVSGNTKLDSLLNAIDNAIENAHIYTATRHARIANYKRIIEENIDNPTCVYQLNNALYNEYKSFKCDSATFYLTENIDIARKLNDKGKITESLLNLSHLYSSSGRYEAAIDILHDIDRESLSKKLLSKYYLCYNQAYNEMVSLNIGGNVLHGKYEALLKVYKDSLTASLDKTDEKYLELEESRCREENRLEDAMRINDVRLKNITPDSAQYALVMFQRALTYNMLGDSLKGNECFALSALSDIRLATKDHASLWMLAESLYKHGYFDRASRYMRFSWDDTNFYDSPLRYWQSSSIQRIIDNQYKDMIMERNRSLTYSVISIAALAVMLLFALLYILKQKTRLGHANNNLQEINGKLDELNSELSRLNSDLAEANFSLQESNRIKEAYISRFIKLCSEYIDKLKKLRTTVHKGLSQGKTDEMMKMLRPKSGSDDDVRVLYENFDTAFLHIFPDFVSQFNALLLDSEQITPKSGELLNTELRIFALIRLGFNDSSEIAEILRYSVNTIYNYRAQVKNKAKGNRSDFERLIMNIR